MLSLAVVMSIALPAAAQPHLDRVEPFRLKVQKSGRVPLEIGGSLSSNTTGHPDVTHYEHWAVRRAEAGAAWVDCTLDKSSPCSVVSSGFLGDLSSMTLSIDAASFLAAPGWLDIKLREGLEPGPDSNVVRVPILEVFGAPPLIVSVTPKQFKSGGAPDDFIMRIAANNFDPSNVAVVFRGDTVVYPMRVLDGTTVEVRVPEKYRNGNGELSLQLRTDSGGYSPEAYFKVLKPGVVKMIVPTTVKPAVPPVTTTVPKKPVKKEH